MQESPGELPVGECPAAERQHPRVDHFLRWLTDLLPPAETEKQPQGEEGSQDTTVSLYQRLPEIRTDTRWLRGNLFKQTSKIL